MAKRPKGGLVCPRCGGAGARVIGHAEELPILYIRCDDCGKTSIAPE